MINQTCYDVLGIMPEANFDDIRRAYIRLAKQYHPDLAENADDRRMAEINAAYEILSNQSKKGEYDIRFRPVEVHDFTKVQAKDTVERKKPKQFQQGNRYSKRAQKSLKIFLLASSFYLLIFILIKILSMYIDLPGWAHILAP